MTKHYCDLCHKELGYDKATITVAMQEHEYTSHEYCLDCFFDSAKWPSMHKRPKKEPSLWARYKAQKNKKRK